MKKILIAISFLLLVALACSMSPTVTDTQPSGNAPSGNAPSGPRVLFSDDFSNTSGGWDIVDVEYKTTDYDGNGAFRFWVNRAQLDIWSVPHQNFSKDMIVEVDATKIGGPNVNDFGVTCRYSKVEQSDGSFLYNFYFFLISSDGKATIAVMNDNEQAYLTESGVMEPASAVNRGDATNRIRAECIGNSLSLYVNGDLVASVSDNTHSGGGDAGLIAGTFDELGTEILFDNFAVSRP